MHSLIFVIIETTEKITGKFTGTFKCLSALFTQNHFCEDNLDFKFYLIF